VRYVLQSLLCVLVVVAVSGSPDGADSQPVANARIPSLPMSRVVPVRGGGRVCGYDSPASTSSARGQGLVTVDPNPTLVTAVWLPGMNDRTCHVLVTHGDRRLARRIARDIDTSPAMKDGVYSCPLDSGAEVKLYFGFTRRRAVEEADLTPGGCVTIGAPGRGVRSGYNVLRDIAPIEPPGFLDRGFGLATR